VTQRLRVIKKRQRGFAMLVVIIIAALLAMLAGTLLQLVQSDLVMMGQTRRSFESREVAEGAVAQVINDTGFLAQYPPLDHPTLQSPLYPTLGSPFMKPDRTFDANVRLLRIGPPTESSLEQSRIITYEVRALAMVAGNAATTEVVAEVLRTIAYPRGWVPIERHYR